MAKTSPEESVMRYFETQPIEKAEVMLSIAKSIVKKRFSAPVDTNQKTYLNPSPKKTKKNHHKAHISEVGSWPGGQEDKIVAELNAGNAVWGTNGPIPPSPLEISIKTIQANMDAMGVGSANKYPLHGAYAPGENPGVDGSVYPSYAELQKPEPQFKSLALAEFKKMAEGLAEKEKKAKKKAEPEEPPF